MNRTTYSSGVGYKPATINGYEKSVFTLISCAEY